MKRRYAFWRDEKGSPYRKDDNRNTPSEILTAWGKGTKVDANGSLTHDAFSSLRLEAALKMAFVVEERSGVELDEADAWGIAREALASVIRGNGGERPIQPDEFLASADAAAQAFIGSVAKPYVLLASISLAPFQWKSVEVGDCTIKPIRDRGKFRLPKILTSPLGDGHIGRHLENTKYQWVAISTKGRSIHEATRRAIEALSLLRAVATITYDAGCFRLHFGARTPRSMSIIHAGPVYTLHELDGRPVDDDTYWIERIRVEDQQLFQPNDGISNFVRTLRSRIRRISRLPYKIDIEQLLLRYISALDNTDHDLAFLQMWSILEKITDTIGGKYDDTINRATWWFHDRPIAKQYLACIRIQRNRYVHASRTSGEPDQGAYLIKLLIEPHLSSLVGHAFSVPTLREYAEILDQPVDADALATLKRRLKFAQRIHGSKKRG